MKIVKNIIDKYKLTRKQKYFNKTYILKDVCLLQFNEEITYINSKPSIDKLIEKYKNIGVIYGNMDIDTNINVRTREYVTHAIHNFVVKKDGLYGNIKFLTTPSAKIVTRILIETGIKNLKIVPKLSFKNNIIIEIYTFDCNINKNIENNYA